MTQFRTELLAAFPERLDHVVPAQFRKEAAPRLPGTGGSLFFRNSGRKLLRLSRNCLDHPTHRQAAYAGIRRPSRQAARRGRSLPYDVEPLSHKACRIYAATNRFARYDHAGTLQLETHSWRRHCANRTPIREQEEGWNASASCFPQCILIQNSIHIEVDMTGGQTELRSADVRTFLLRFVSSQKSYS